MGAFVLGLFSPKTNPAGGGFYGIPIIGGGLVVCDFFL